MCDSCQHKFKKKELTLGPNPFFDEIYKNTTNYILCAVCYKDYADDI